MAQPSTSGLHQSQYSQPPSYNQGQFYFVPSGSPPPNSNSSTQNSTPNITEKSKTSAKNRWDEEEVRILIASYKEHYGRLKTTKSSRGKKSTWDLIYDEFIEQCTDAKIKTTKTLTQIKEKWRVLFVKYKTVVDNNKKTGRGRIDFEFFDDIDDFMGHSDKVNPKYVKESGIMDDTEDEDGPENIEEVEINDGETSSKTKKKGDANSERPAKKKKRDTESETSKLMELLEKQQEAMIRAEENDKKALETIMTMQNDAEKRHQQFMVAALGKLGDIFSKK